MSANHEDQKTLPADRALYGSTDGSHHLVNTYYYYKTNTGSNRERSPQVENLE